MLKFTIDSEYNFCITAERNECKKISLDYLDTVNNGTNCNRTCNGISMYYQNVRGLRSKEKVASFNASLLQSNYDVIALTETNLIQSVDSSELFGKNFTVHRCDRSTSNSHKIDGGGVLIAVRSCYSSEVISVEHSKSLEIIFVEVIFQKTEVYICCLYIPPGSSSNIYNDYSNCIRRFVDTISRKKIFLIVGDFNLPATVWCSDDGDESNILLPLSFRSKKEMINVGMLFDCDLKQVNHCFNFRGILLDYVLSNRPNHIKVAKCSPLSKIDPHHEPVSILLKFCRRSETNKHFQSEVFFSESPYYIDVEGVMERLIQTKLSSPIAR